MPKEVRDWLVFLTNEGLAEAQKQLADFLHEGLNGFYLDCKQVDMHQPFLYMVIDDPLTDGTPFEIEIYLPHRYVKFIAAGTEKRLIGFLEHAM